MKTDIILLWVNSLNLTHNGQMSQPLNETKSFTDFKHLESLKFHVDTDDMRKDQI